MLDKKIHIIGLGPGNPGLLTGQALEALKNSQAVIGASRMVEAVRNFGIQADFIKEYQGERIVSWLEVHWEEWKVVSLVFSGDISLYSGAKGIRERLCRSALLGEAAIHSHPGISSLSYMAGHLGLDIGEIKILSLHGKKDSFVNTIRENTHTFLLTDHGEQVKEVLDRLKQAGLGQARIHIGENLSYPQERFLYGTIQDFSEEPLQGLISLIIVNKEARILRQGICDGAFFREKIPMTKEEVRTVILSKLQIQPKSICYDIGAGTGSVSVEMALQAKRGRVYAIEKKEEACRLIQKNQEKFGVSNLEIIKAMAPEGLESVSQATHIFIGGSSKRLPEIMERIFSSCQKLSSLVISAISLETLALFPEIFERARQEGFQGELIQIGISRGREVGDLHMLLANNPVFLAHIRK